MASSELQRFPRNVHGRDFFVGDIHGCHSLLMEKLEAVNFDKKVDRVFSVGDLVDRGPESSACLSLPWEPWFHAVLGNHEEMMLDALRGGDDAFWIMNGGSWILRQNRDAVLRKAEAALSDMPLAMEVDCGGRRIGVIHADVTSKVWGKFNREKDLWSRSRIAGVSSGAVEGIDLVVVGHSVLEDTACRDNVVYIDTGGVFNGNLQLLEADQLFALMAWAYAES